MISNDLIAQYKYSETQKVQKNSKIFQLFFLMIRISIGENQQAKRRLGG